MVRSSFTTRPEIVDYGQDEDDDLNLGSECSCSVSCAWLKVHVNVIVGIFCFDCYSVQVAVIFGCLYVILKPAFRLFCLELKVVFLPVVLNGLNCVYL
jgi:hypothetical protein